MIFQRLFVYAAFVLAALLLMFGGFHLVEEVRGRRMWAAYEKKARADGRKLDIVEFVGPSIPDAENYAAIPLFQEVFAASEAGQPAPDRLAFPESKYSPPSAGGIFRGERTNLATWREYFLAIGLISAASERIPDDILQGLERYQPFLDQIRDASTRPGAKFPVKWAEGTSAKLSHLSLVHQLRGLFVLKMTCFLAKQDSARAYAEFSDGLRLYRALRTDPNFLAGLVRIKLLRSLAESVWEGITQDQWAVAELEKLQRDFASLDLMDDLQFAIDSERGAANRQMERLLKMSRAELAEVFMGSMQSARLGDAPPFMRAIIYSYPHGWVLQNQVIFNEQIDRWLDELKRAAVAQSPAVPFAKVGEVLDGWDSWNRVRYAIAAAQFAALGSADENSRFADVEVKQAEVACALQRFRHQRGAYPEKLTELLPAFIADIPRDIFSYHPLLYRRVSEDDYLLWSVGRNGVDDGGKADRRQPSDRQPDLVWPSKSTEQKGKLSEKLDIKIEFGKPIKIAPGK